MKLTKKRVLEFLGACVIIGLVTGLVNPENKTDAVLIVIVCAVVLALISAAIELFLNSKDKK